MPDVPDREKLEKQFAKELSKLFGGFAGHLMEILEEHGYSVERIPASVWQELNTKEKATLLPFLEKLSAASAVRLMDANPIGIDWAVINQAAADWARSYSTFLAGELDQTSRGAIATSIRNSIASFFEEGLTLGQVEERLKQDPTLADLFTADVRDKLGRVYGPQRAEMIATTEITRASTEGDRLYADELARQGIVMDEIWETSKMENVCPICKPRDGKKLGDGWTRNDGPPAHPRCICTTRFVLPKPPKIQ